MFNRNKNIDKNGLSAASKKDEAAFGAPEEEENILTTEEILRKVRSLKSRVKK